MDVDDLEEGVWKGGGGGMEEGREGRAGLSRTFSMASVSPTVQVEACWELKVKRTERGLVPCNGIKWFGLHPRSWEVIEGCFVICIFHFGYSRACWVEGGDSKRAGHLP